MKGKRQEEDLKDLKISSSHLLVNNLATGCLKMLCVCVFLRYSNSGFLFLIHGPPLVEFSKSLFSAVFHCAKYFKPHYFSPTYLCTRQVFFWIFGFGLRIFPEYLHTSSILEIFWILFFTIIQGPTVPKQHIQNR